MTYRVGRGILNIDKAKNCNTIEELTSDSDEAPAEVREDRKQSVINNLVAQWKEANMILVAYRGTGNIEKGTILYRIDAWEQDAYEQAYQYIRNEHWIPTEEKITMNGDMIIWVE